MTVIQKHRNDNKIEPCPSCKTTIHKHIDYIYHVVACDKCGRHMREEYADFKYCPYCGNAFSAKDLKELALKNKELRKVNSSTWAGIPEE